MQDIMPQNTAIKPNDSECLIQIAQQLRENLKRFNVASPTTTFSLFASRTPVEDITGTATESENEQKHSI